MAILDTVIPVTLLENQTVSMCLLAQPLADGTCQIVIPQLLAHSLNAATFMLSRLRRSIGRFFNKSRKINHEPINKVSLIVIILVDLVILGNVFAGLDDISRWPLSPSETYHCQAEWAQYRESTAAEKDYEIIWNAPLSPPGSEFSSVAPLANLVDSEQTKVRGRLGEVSAVCVDYSVAQKALDTPALRALAKQINDTQAEITSFSLKNNTIRQQYDSTLLEEIAGQSREQSINNVGAAEARQEIESNERAIAQRETTLKELKRELVALPESEAFLRLLNNDAKFEQVDNGYQRASFWYPSIQLLFQGLFLLPLIIIASAVHRFAQRQNYGYVALISWHLFVIFCIPLVWKLFEFLQVGFLVEWLLELLEVLFGGLRFLINYLQILLIPVIGFGIIKFFQKVVFNTRLQAANRVQKGRCVRCAKKIRKHDEHCPHCGYAQYRECHNCHSPTYKHLPHCKHCGAKQPLDL